MLASIVSVLTCTVCTHTKPRDCLGWVTVELHVKHVINHDHISWSLGDIDNISLRTVKHILNMKVMV